MLRKIEKRGASAESLADELPSTKRIETYCPRQITESTEEIDDDEPYHRIEELDEDFAIVSTANEILKHPEVVQLLDGLLQTLSHDAQDNIINRALNHFEKVKSVWQNMSLIEVFLKYPCLPSTAENRRLARLKLSEFLMHKIRSDPSFTDIFKHQDDASIIRNALSILIGYWSNEDMIPLLVFSMGRHSLGIKSDCEDNCLSMAEENTLSWVEKEHEKIMHTESSTPNEGMQVYSPIAHLLQDASIKDLANNLVKIPRAVTLAKKVLKYLQVDTPAGHTAISKYYKMHKATAVRFWYHPGIILEISKAMKKSASLVNVFKKFSKGAEILRCMERVTRIQKDPLLDSILVGDRVQKMRGALSVLFGYWSDRDVIKLYLNLVLAKYLPTTTLNVVELSKDDEVQDIDYLTHGLGDTEGLKNVLTDMYIKDSVKYQDLFLKIKKRQEIEEQKNATEPGHVAIVTVLLKKEEIFSFEIRRFSQKRYGFV